VVGHASPQEIARAGAQLLRTCVIERGTGGLAYLIGEHEQPESTQDEDGYTAVHHSPILDLLD